MPAAAEKKDYLDVLFPEIKVEGYDVKPWTLKQTRLATPVAVKVVQKIMQWLEENRSSQGFPEDTSKITPDQIVKILSELLPQTLEHAPEILSITYGWAPEEVDEKDGATMSALYLAVLVKNVEWFHSFFGNILGGGVQLTIGK